jgi:hypothetical protein
MVEHKCLDFRQRQFYSHPFQAFTKVMKAAFLFAAAIVLGAVSADEHSHVVIAGMQMRTTPTKTVPNSLNPIVRSEGGGGGLDEHHWSDE